MAGITPNYAIGEQFIENLMIDRCFIYRDPEQVFDQTLDLDTGLLGVQPGGDIQSIYRGKCLVKPSQSKVVELGGEPTEINSFPLLVPVGVTGLRYQDRVRIIKARIPDLLNHLYRIISVGSDTHRVYVRAEMQDLTFGA